MGKNRASPACATLPAAALAPAPLRGGLFRVRHPRSARRRLALHSAEKKSLRYRFADFFPAPFRLKAALPALFLLFVCASRSWFQGYRPGACGAIVELLQFVSVSLLFAIFQVCLLNA
ncbi:MAG: hypothetical protein FWG54_06070 [Bacteroidetes bacterium]|nr:hypothetical protein [Bacteroidota bacterium]